MQEINKSNPLLKHFRQPALYIELTSQGKFWPEGSLDLPVTGKIPVYPMTTRDEITLRTPDALIDGTSVVEVIQSCCPNIKNAWDMPSIDVDSTLMAIRMASYGPSMSIKSQCPHCQEEHEYDINLSGMLDGIKAPNYDIPVKLDNGLTIFLKPMNYRNVSQTGEVGLEEQRLIQTLGDPDLTEEQRRDGYEKHLKTMVDLSISTLANCTHSIIIDQGETVTDFDFIKEFYANVDGKVLRFVQQQLAEFTKDVNIKPVQAVCDNEDCGKQFDITVTFDYAGFFDRGF